MLNCIFKIPLDIYICFQAGDHSANRADLQQHALKVKQVITAKDGLSMAGKYFMQISLGEFMTELWQAAFASLFGSWVDQFKSHKDLMHHELFHPPDAIDDPFLTDGERRCTTRWILEY